MIVNTRLLLINEYWYIIKKISFCNICNPAFKCTLYWENSEFWMRKLVTNIITIILATKFGIKYKSRRFRASKLYYLDFRDFMYFLEVFMGFSILITIYNESSDTLQNIMSQSSRAIFIQIARLDEEIYIIVNGTDWMIDEKEKVQLACLLDCVRKDFTNFKKRFWCQK